MRSLLKTIVPFAFAFIASVTLVETIKTVLDSDASQAIAPVKTPASLFEPCVPPYSQSSEWMITSSPVGYYTNEAQSKRVSGVVKLAVYLDFDGKVSIAGVISRLPYGLTEEAIKAAKQIKFKPATSCDRPITEPAEIHYEFPSGQGTVVQL